MTEYVKQFGPGVVEVPGRKFPGIVVMGDTLATMAQDVYAAIEFFRESRGDESEALEALEHVFQQMQTYLNAYESTLRSHGISRPYAGDISKRRLGPTTE